MKLFKASEYFFEKLGIIPLDEKQSSAVKAFAIYIAGILIFYIFFHASCLFVVHHPNENSDCIGAIMLASGCVCSVIKYSFLKFHGKKLKNLIMDFRKTHNEGM